MHFWFATLPLTFFRKGLFPFRVFASGLQRKLLQWRHASQHTLLLVQQSWPALSLPVQTSIYNEQLSCESIGKIQNLSLLLSHLQPLYDSTQPFQAPMQATNTFLSNLLQDSTTWLQYTIHSTTAHDSLMLYGLLQYLKVLL